MQAPLKKKKGIPLLARKDTLTGRVKFEGREFQLYLAGKPDVELGHDYHLFTYAKEFFLKMDPEKGEGKAKVFRKIFMDVINYMAIRNESFEITNPFATSKEEKEKVPVFTLYSDHHTYYEKK